MEYLAHSEQQGIPAQSYVEHVSNVKKSAIRFARAVAGGDSGNPTLYAKKDGTLLVQCAEEVAEWHDTGKLLDENQAVLRQKDSHAKLPTNHADAGAAVLMRSWQNAENVSALAAYSHHQGLPNIAEETIKEKDCYRFYDPEKGWTDKYRTDAQLETLIALHQKLTGADVEAELKAPVGDFGVFSRMLLSCLADADHTDTAIHYKKYPENRESILLRPEERLAKLDQHVSGFEITDERNKLRADMYRACRHSDLDANIVACDSPVGSGKTIAIMAHLLSQAIKRKARRVFVVLPFTNIIQQSVDVYRNALVLPGEDPTEVVAELHHRADFQSVDARTYTAQWRAPIIVTTAVAFFETIASNRPAGLRRLHELPGSVIFVDEAHAALPVKLLPVAWHWIQVLADEWSCYWVLASGSLVEFWNIPDISKTQREVPQLVENRLRERLLGFENRRIDYPVIDTPLSREELVERIIAEPGPRLVILNTVQSAAVIANDLLESYKKQAGGSPVVEKVFHLSTALSAEDRERVVKAVKKKLDDNRNGLDADTDWVLVATSCVEAGVDFSFRTGFREKASLLSLVQAAGRIGRNGEIEDARIWSFSVYGAMLTDNPMLNESQEVLEDLIDEETVIGPELSTEAVVREIKRGNDPRKTGLLQSEEKKNYREVGDRFRVIESNTVLVIADMNLKQRLRFGECDWQEIQRKGIPMRLDRVLDLKLEKLLGGEEKWDRIYDWNLRYDSFLGIMAGVLDVARSSHEFLDY